MANVLVVDDSKVSRTILVKYLKEYGLNVVAEACDGVEGFQKYKEYRPDLVTMDITMPNMDGLECLRAILQEDPKARVIMVSAAGQQSNILTSIKTGAKDFMLKPFDEEEMKNVLDRALA